MKLNINSWKAKLFGWFLGSQIILVAYFLLFIHYNTVPFSFEILVALFLVLTLIGLVLIFNITSALTYLTSRIKQISTKNLSERIEGIKGDDEIGQLAQNFNEMLNRLNDAFKREQQFIADVAHELKTPLATLRGSMEITLERPRTGDEYRKVLKEAIAETNRLSLTLNNVLDLAWTEAPKTSGDKEEIDLSGLVAELVEIAQKMAYAKKIKIESVIGEDIHINGFREKLARAFMNIIDNAIKYTPEKGVVRIVLETASDKVLFTASDNGPGISEEELPHIFDRFYRSKKTKKAIGSGLGLAIAKSIIALHQGDIIVKSQVDKGATFVIVLPR